MADLILGFGGRVNGFEKLGFKVVRQKGSHVVLRKLDKGGVVPIHKELAAGTLRSAIRQAGENQW